LRRCRRDLFRRYAIWMLSAHSPPRACTAATHKSANLKQSINALDTGFGGNTTRGIERLHKLILSGDRFAESGANGPAFRQARSRGVKREGILRGSREGVRYRTVRENTFFGRAIIRGSLCSLPDMTRPGGKRLLEVNLDCESFPQEASKRRKTPQMIPF
jgi:hypothetical protein